MFGGIFIIFLEKRQNFEKFWQNFEFFSIFFSLDQIFEPKFGDPEFITNQWKKLVIFMTPPPPPTSPLIFFKKGIPPGPFGRAHVCR